MKEIVYTKHVEKACSFCGQMFTPKYERAQYCSKVCSGNASKVRRGIDPVLTHKKICKGCGEEFETRYKRKVFCCRRCKDKNRGYVPKPRTVKPKKVTPPVEYETRACVICGKEFEVDKRRLDKTCSHECSKENAREKQRICHRNREKRIASVLVDRDISLETLRRRDNNVCWICGKETDPTDYKIVNGTTVVGDSYPSIDHLLPIARGGLHQWENIRLAHKGCNQQRGATLCDKVDELTREEARRFAREISPNKKEVIQFIDGVEYARYESTREAARLNNFKDKSIQNACRGEGTGDNHRMYGFEWEYATR